VATGAAAVAAGSGVNWAQPTTAPAGPFVLPPLGYAFDALEPNIDTQTMNIHYTRHHGAFIANLNRLHAANPSIDPKDLAGLLANDCARVPEAVRTPIRNNLGGHVNHTLYWEVMNPAERLAEPTGDLLEKIDNDLGGWAKAKTDLTAAAMGRFGSGWAWLVVRDGKLAITSTANQDSPLMGPGVPILGIDVWEHAYYLKHQNRRADYVAAFWDVVNWRVVGEKFAEATK
jgi:Fe-Mn family superoxide dismutase